jgi:hypothetical protein
LRRRQCQWTLAADVIAKLVQFLTTLEIAVAVSQAARGSHERWVRTIRENAIDEIGIVQVEVVSGALAAEQEPEPPAEAIAQLAEPE